MLIADRLQLSSSCDFDYTMKVVMMVLIDAMQLEETSRIVVTMSTFGYYLLCLEVKVDLAVKPD